MKAVVVGSADMRRMQGNMRAHVPGLFPSSTPARHVDTLDMGCRVELPHMAQVFWAE